MAQAARTGAAAGLPSTVYVTDAANRLVSDSTCFYEYDQEGNLTRRTDIATGQATCYEWDYRNRLVQAATFDQVSVAADFTATVPYTGQESTGSLQVLDDGRAIELCGNIWRAWQMPATYIITADTYIEFDYKSDVFGEIQGIGFDANNSYGGGYLLQLQGNQTGVPGTTPITPVYAADDGWRHYRVRIADLGGFLPAGTQINYLVLANDADGTGPIAGANSQFANVLVYNRATTGATSGTKYVYDASDHRVWRAYYPDWMGGIGASSESFVYATSSSPSGRGWGEGQLSMRFDANSQLTHRYLYGPETDQVLTDEVFATDWGSGTA